MADPCDYAADSPFALGDPIALGGALVTLGGSVLASGCAYIIETGASQYMTEAELAAAIGCSESSIVSLRSGIPHWRLIRESKLIAEYFNENVATLRAKITRDLQQVIGRGRSTFPSSPPGRQDYGGVIAPLE